ncbi:hypothetical protein WJ70_24915 [Burkholderia ubonensis]|uniref:hypothetical protein n=1 Tax=Burkholderia ubonensis TaxID=101571 RepID=UPI0007544209|nr:hypothetical protein [Burkholderia ubonensis]KVO07037.1 hypothetical protein WJ70_24915 [Burkholderia ubonensis]
MIPTFVRHTVHWALWCITIAAALCITLLVTVAVARSETDEGTCPDLSADVLHAKVRAFLAERRVPLTDAYFDGLPTYHADSVGWWKSLDWWGFRLNSREGTLIATMDCNGRIAYAAVEPSIPTRRR